MVASVNENKIARILRDALATPLQNSLLELYGLVSFVDERVFGDLDSFRSQFGQLKDAASFDVLKHRIAPICKRTLRRQVEAYVKYARRIPMLREFVAGADEVKRYNYVSDYLQRDALFALPNSQRQRITIAELESFRKLAVSITENAKGTTLLQALTVAFKSLNNSALRKKPLSLPSRAAHKTTCKACWPKRPTPTALSYSMAATATRAPRPTSFAFTSAPFLWIKSLALASLPMRTQPIKLRSTIFTLLLFSSPHYGAFMFLLPIFSSVPESQNIDHLAGNFVAHLVLTDKNPSHLARLELE